MWSTESILGLSQFYFLSMPKKSHNKLGADQEAVHAEDAINLILPLRVYLFIYFKEKK